MQDSIFVDGVPFFAVSHHDSQFIRAPGLAAFARRDADVGYTILNFELCEAINRSAGPNHPRWGWALCEGMDTLLVHLAERASKVAAATEVTHAPPVRWHAEADAPFGQPDLLDEAAVWTPTLAARIDR